MTVQEEQDREMAIMAEINSYALEIHRREQDIAIAKGEIEKLNWQLTQLRYEFRSEPEL
jgi:hypothetical protein